MLKIALLKDSSQTIGGGFTFLRNLVQGLKGKVEVTSLELCDVALISSASMVTKETVYKAVELKKPLVLRVDNIPRNSRNRNTGTSRLKRYAELAKTIVFQSQWAREYISPFLGRDGHVIWNGIDLDIFSPTGQFINFEQGQYSPIYIYSRYNRDETKRWEEAWYRFQMIARHEPKAKLIIVGNFSSEIIECNFDFFQGENYEYLGIIDDPEQMANIYRGCNFFLATYYNDAYSNTYQEALACGVKLLEPSMTGGTPELLKYGPRSLYDMANQYLKVLEEAV